MLRVCSDCIVGMHAEELEKSQSQSPRTHDAR
jgi:hypothetical protein